MKKRDFRKLALKNPGFGGRTARNRVFLGYLVKCRSLVVAFVGLLFRLDPAERRERVRLRASAPRGVGFRLWKEYQVAQRNAAGRLNLQTRRGAVVLATPVQGPEKREKIAPRQKLGRVERVDLFKTLSECVGEPELENEKVVGN